MHTRHVPKRQTVFRGRIFHVDRERVLLPHGHRVTMDIIRHRGSVVLAPQPSPGEVILIRQYRHAINRWIWELPAGTIEPGELLLAFTDGVLDARSPAGEPFGEERLEAAVRSPFQSAGALVDRIRGSLSAHILGSDPFDDVTMLAVRRAASAPDAQR